MHPISAAGFDMRQIRCRFFLRSFIDTSFAMLMKACNVFDRLQTARLTTRRHAQRAIGAAVLALIFAVVMCLAAGDAQACPPGASIAASISHKLAAKSVLNGKAVIASQVMVTAKSSTLKSSPSRGLGTCCGGSHGFGCPQSGCAFCAVAVFDAAPAVVIEKTVPDYVLARGEDMPSAGLDPNFRPPCVG